MSDAYTPPEIYPLYWSVCSSLILLYSRKGGSTLLLSQRLSLFPPDKNRPQHLTTNPNPSNLIYPVICNRLQVGNKSDLLRARQVPADEGETLAASLGGASSHSPFILFFCNVLLVFRYFFLLLFMSLRDLHILHIWIKPPAESSMKLAAL